MSEIEKSGVFDMCWLSIICKLARLDQIYRGYLMGLYLTCPYDAPYSEELYLLTKVYGE